MTEKIRRRPIIWTEADRLCGQCNQSPATSDDWLCRCCRERLETDWSRLTRNPSCSYAEPELAPPIRPYA